MGEPRYTEKEMVMAKREAFTDGAVCWAGQVRDELRGGIGGRFVTLANIKADAHTKFPLPRVERPRVVTDAEGHQWSFTGFPEPGALLMHRRTPGHGWSNNHPGITTENASVLADLLAHPSEFVDDEG